ncbi:HAD-IIB family hydrolase [Mesoplasma melaleucae]|uniref:HAD family hydrolase n=1 Tax=Mesoplasma melaleucae TaxID=81459 RepID=A0A2K8NXB4_9MOLU|nr:HAD family hydrolase [Mesoplasma melaleucae]ATZ18186.1 HAD family hydrolase [Mesoplasma melaleucae]
MKLTNIKLIATDLDGTVLEHGEIANEFDLVMLKKAAAQGIQIAVVTGQGWSSGSVRAKMFDVDKHADVSIFSNGSVISKVSSFEPGYCKTIDSDLVKEFMLKMYELNIPTLAYTKIPAHCYSNGLEIKVKSLVDRQWVNKYNVENVDIKTFTNYQDVIQLMIFVEQKEEAAMLEWFENTHKAKFLNKMRSNVETIPIYEFINLKASKGNGVLKLAELLNISIDDVLVFGDNMNDMSMFEVVPNSVAMGNSVPAIKQIAKYETDTNLNGGVGKFIEKYVLEK